MLSFGERLDATFSRQGQLCLGIDPHSFLLTEWGLADTADGVRTFALKAIESAAGVVGIVKPQVAFFERHGSAGYAVLEEVLAAARAAGLLVIADAKRGDVGSTVAAYTQAWLSPGSPLEADAMTISAYQGVGSLTESVEFAQLHGKGLFVLAATSNPESFALQAAVLDSGDDAGITVAASIVAEVNELNESSEHLGSVGVVIGATVRAADYGIAAGSLAFTPILAPGFGEQGATLADLPALYGMVSTNVVANVGRSVLRTGPDKLRGALVKVAAELQEALAS